MDKYFIYIMSNKNKSFHIGMTNDLSAVIYSNENLPEAEKNILVFYEVYTNKIDAEERLKEINSWLKRKIALVVNLVNPEWDDWGKEFIEGGKYNSSFSFS